MKDHPDWGNEHLDKLNEGIGIVEEAQEIYEENHKEAETPKQEAGTEKTITTSSGDTLWEPNGYSVLPTDGSGGTIANPSQNKENKKQYIQNHGNP